MAAGFCSSTLWLLFRPTNNIYPQTRAISKAISVRLLPRTLSIRNLCRSSVVCEEKPELSAASSSKSRAEFKAACYHIRKLCESRRLHEASHMLNNLLRNFRDTSESFTSVCNCALHHAVKNNDGILVERILSNMNSHSIIKDSATYYIIALHFSKQGLLHEGINSVKEMQAETIRVTPRNYQPLIELAAQLGKLDTMFSLYEEMKSKHSSCHQFDAVAIQSVIDSNETENWSGKVFEILHKMKLDRIKLSKETAVVVTNWFGIQDNGSWQVNWSTVNSSGVCQSCNHGLESGVLSSLENAVLEQHIIDYLWESTQGRKMTSYTTIGSFADKHYPEDGHHLPYSLEKYIHETGPYDIVLDALNVGYYGNKGEFHPKQVEETVQYFLLKGKKVLVVGAPPMLTRKMRNASQEDFASMIDVMSKNCGIFLIRVRSNKNVHKLCIPDDIFMLLAAVHCGPNTLLVSNDLFQDHMHKLPFNAQALLKRWLRSNQVWLQRSPEENKINYKKYPSYDPVVQTTGKTWHLPLDDNTTWLCCHKQQ